MTNETKPDTTPTEAENSTNNSTDNKALFGPLGKYAIVAVIMVSIIVTTAIMLNKQLNNVEHEIAIIENEVSEMNSVASDTASTTNNETVTADVVTEEIVTSETVIAETSNEQHDNQAANDTQKKAEPITEATAENTAEQVKQTPAIEVAAADNSKQATPADVRRTQRQRENQARVAANKHEQKQQMSEVFARINRLEAQQLEQYKANQDKNIVRLRGHNVQQQYFIDALVLRNDELLNMRKTNIQKQQANREQILNRI